MNGSYARIVLVHSPSAEQARRAGAEFASDEAIRLLCTGVAGQTFTPLAPLVEAAPSDLPGDVLDRLAVVAGTSEGAYPAPDLFWSVRKLVERLATERAVRILVDDIHRAGYLLFALLEHVGSYAMPNDVLIVCTARTGSERIPSHWWTAGVVEVVAVEGEPDEDPPAPDPPVPHPPEDRIRAADRALDCYDVPGAIELLEGLEDDPRARALLVEAYLQVGEMELAARLDPDRTVEIDENRLRHRSRRTSEHLDELYRSDDPDALRAADALGDQSLFDHLIEAKRLAVMGGLFGKLGRFDEARALLVRALRLQDEFGQIPSLGSTPQIAAEVELTAGDPDKAEWWLNLDYELLEDLADDSYLRESNELLARAREMKRNA